MVDDCDLRAPARAICAVPSKYTAALYAESPNDDDDYDGDELNRDAALNPRRNHASGGAAGAAHPSEGYTFVAATSSPRAQENSLCVLDCCETTGELRCVSRLSLAPHGGEVWACAVLSATDSHCLCATAGLDPSSANARHQTCQLWSLPQPADSTAGAAGSEQQQQQQQPVASLSQHYPHRVPDVKGLRRVSPPDGGNASASLQLLLCCSEGVLLLDADLRVTASCLLPGPPSSSRACNDAAVEAHNNNEVVMAAGEDILVWDCREGQVVARKEAAHTGGALTIDSNPNLPNRIASGGVDAALRLWDLRRLATPLRVVADTHHHWLSCLRINPFHDELIATGSTDHTVKLWTIDPMASSSSGQDGGGGRGKKKTNTQMEEEDKKPLLLAVEDRVEESVMDVAWSETDAWALAAVTYDGHVLSVVVPVEEKYRILL
eukprot:GHVU01227274.1.p1 GENE.GHVU01227274.1~~GHVU01227274.1.p1  ORF type:complete len:436 (-),score=113.12 GHVU01227274.1:242-1549(-)